MKIVVAHPPNIEAILRRFPLALSPGVVFTYGDTLYSPIGPVLPRDIIAHEGVHSRQQEPMGPEEWWKRYIEDATFMVLQEIPAYRRQYQVFCSIVARRGLHKIRLFQLAKDLSGPLYGSALTFDAARSAILANG